MIYTLLFIEFFKIGLFAIGGGMVAVPFLFDIAERYDWFTAEQLVNMIAVSESTPGPIGINMATYAGFMAAGWQGALVASLSVVLPALIIVSIVAKLLTKYRSSCVFLNMMYSLRPAVIALILYAGIELAKLSITDMWHGLICVIFWGAIRFFKLHPIIYIIVGGVLGVLLEL